MNTQKIGTEFEAKAYKFLKNKFDNVNWLSEKNTKSKFDFECILNGKKLYGDAKYKSKKRHIILTNKQKDADFVITNNVDDIFIIYKEDFKGKVYVAKINRNVIGVYLDEELVDKLRVEGKKLKRSISFILNEMLIKYFEKRK